MVQEAAIDPEDERALAAFMAPGHDSFKQFSLGDLIVSKLKEKQTEGGVPVLPE